MILSDEELKGFDEAIRKALHENYVLKAIGETDEDCIVHDIIASIYRFVEHNCNRK